MNNNNFAFVSPKEAVVFQPTKEEFEDAIAYIQEIRPIAEQYGICRIKPPQGWKPPFALEVDKLKFKPRIQRINELEGCTRVRLNYLRKLSKYWELLGSSLKIPLILGQAIDLHALKQCIMNEGGYEIVNTNEKWENIATKMGISADEKNAAFLLKAHYERLIYPLDVFELEEQRNNDTIKLEENEKQKN